MNCIRLCQITKRQSFGVFNILSARYVSEPPLRFQETQNMWRNKDGLSSQWQLIYKAPMGSILNYASTYLTVTTAVISASAVYYGAFVYNVAEANQPVVIGEDIIIANNAGEGLIYLGAFIALHIAVKILLAKYVIRLYKDGDEYLAIYRGHWFNSVYKHKFHLKDFKKLNPLVVIPWSESRYGLGSKQGILMDNYFKTPEHLNYLLYKKGMSQEDE